MKTLNLFLLLMLSCASGCSQDAHEIHSSRKIPIEIGRWYQLNSASMDLSPLFDGQVGQQLHPAHGVLLRHFEAWYTVMDSEKITIDSIAMHCSAGPCNDEPMTIYAVSRDWKRVPVAVYNGRWHDRWVGPNPAKPDVFRLAKQAADVRFLIIDTWGHFPDEIAFYGSYTPPDTVARVAVRYAPLGNFFGVNAFEWDFEDGKNPQVPDTHRVEAIKNFTAVRHYLDWEKIEPAQGHFTFNPTRNGGWNYDTLYSWCKSNSIEVLACIKTIPGWLQASYLDGQQDNENVPAKFGDDLTDPASYKEQAKAAFQFAARYGHSNGINRNLLTVDTTPRWTGDEVNKIRVGLGLIKYMECDNERDKWWKGRKAYQTGREYAANLSAFYDGDQSRLGPGVGVKMADPYMQVLNAGLSHAVPDYIRGVVDWCREHRGLRTDGTVDLPFDIINYHLYSNDYDIPPGHDHTTGVAPESGFNSVVAASFIDMSRRFAKNKPVWVTETGYDINPASIQRAPAFGTSPALQTQADWILRTSLQYARTGVQRVFFYELDDDNARSATRYATSGLVNEDRSPRPAADYLRQVNQLFGGYSFAQSISTSPVADRYQAGDMAMYVLFVPGQDDKPQDYTLDLGDAATAYIYKPQAGKQNMTVETKATQKGKVNMTLTATPVFVTTYPCGK